ncbi:RNA 2',3'-cyclic phosphodiesterase [Tumebacillus algifaecis]|uniref:RNA 2',3'-cyclic phosphodiesterase n=1 Tax=Tumebacillus algifaecis TaxID=1214604 RepID=A0A223D492_9BACL|nr:RNA 2',3'-cyclic phosphodiesterase [Tumebacillus algifaecis]ASS76277.1 RNA 2',3'-cyclic phosphodiesterase [Tumebacillus algifaecis]
MGRYFLGLDVPQAVCGAKLLSVQRRLEPSLSVKKWYRPEQFHLTTHFLGELDAKQVRQVIESVTPHTAKQLAFTLRLDHAGWFPRAKVVWCGVTGDVERLQGLYTALAGPLNGLGAGSFAHDQYRPHITLGRLQAIDAAWQPPDVSELLQGAEWQVTSLHLYESVSAGAAGPHYPVRHTFRFQEA